MDVNTPLGARAVRCVAAVVMVLAAASEARAQLTDTAGLLGLSVGWGTNDSQRPGPFDYTIDRAVYAISGAAFLSRRLALGAEWVRLGAVTAPGRTPNNHVTEHQQEHAVFGTIRIRAARRPLVALDLIGAAGMLMESRQTTSRASLAAAQTGGARSPAYAARLELPVALARHVAIAPAAAVYFLRRTDLSVAPGSLSRTGPSMRATFGATAQVAW
jgi:hypothetical protein